MGAKKGDFFGAIARRFADVSSIGNQPDNVTIVKEAHELCLKQMNLSFETKLVVNVDWLILPPNLNQWKMPKGELKKGMFNLYYYPLESALDAVLKTKTDLKEIRKHVESIEILPHDKLGYAVSFKKDKLYIMKNFTADFISLPHFKKVKEVAEDLAKLLDPQTKKHPK